MDKILLLILLPLVASSFVWMLKGAAARITTLVFSLATAGLAGYYLLFSNCNCLPGTGVNLEWLPALGISFRLGLDGTGVLMVALAAFLTPLIILSTFNREIPQAPAMYSLIMLMQAGMIGVFLAYDLFVFYLFWELALIPIYFISGYWGGADRVKVTTKFFVYTLLGSLLMLAGIIFLYLQSSPRSFDWFVLSGINLDTDAQRWVFWAFFAAFAIKIPIFPFHTWQPDTYTQAPTAGTMLLSAIMLKMGVFGFLRWVIPVIPIGFSLYASTALLLAVIGIIYASVIAIRQQNLKTLIAYSSIAHVGLIAAGVFAANSVSVTGAIFQMLSHGIVAIGLFYAADIIENRTKTLDIDSLGGIASVAPRFATLFLITVMGAVALPLTNGFVGEFLLLKGVFDSSAILGSIAATTIILGAFYTLRMFRRVMYGETNPVTASFTDLNTTETIVLSAIALLIIGLGVYPISLLEVADTSVSSILTRLSGGLAIR